MNIEIVPGKLKGRITSIPSKSDAHRIIICAALSGNLARVALESPSEDIQATYDAAGVINNVRIANAIHIASKEPIVDCGESGTTLRLLVPVAAALGLDLTFIGRGRLPQRPMEPMLSLLRAHGIEVTGEHLPLHIKGQLQNGVYSLPGNISSQYISGLLLALPLVEGDSTILLTTPLESSGYVDMTLQSMQRFGVTALSTNGGWSITGNQTYKAPSDISIEGDWSNSAFWLVANALGSDIQVTGLSEQTHQKDSQIKEILCGFPNRIDVKDIPDLVPILAVAACGLNRKTLIENCSRLRLKESDRIKSVCKMINNLGGKAEEKSDCIVIHGEGTLKGGIVDSANDHRIAMAAAIAATICKNKVVITGAEAVNKSYPDFFADYKDLGGNAHVI